MLTLCLRVCLSGGFALKARVVPDEMAMIWWIFMFFMNIYDLFIYWKLNIHAYIYSLHYARNKKSIIQLENIKISTTEQCDFTEIWKKTTTTTY